MWKRKPSSTWFTIGPSSSALISYQSQLRVICWTQVPFVRETGEDGRAAREAPPSSLISAAAAVQVVTEHGLHICLLDISIWARQIRAYTQHGTPHAPPFDSVNTTPTHTPISRQLDCLDNVRTYVPSSMSLSRKRAAPHISAEGATESQAFLAHAHGARSFQAPSPGRTTADRNRPVRAVSSGRARKRIFPWSGCLDGLPLAQRGAMDLLSGVAVSRALPS